MRAIHLLTKISILLISIVSAHAEELSITHCYSGSSTFFSHGSTILVSWNSNGIIMSNHPKKLLHNAVEHCEGTQRGGGPSRIGDGLCKIVDEEGDAIIAVSYT